MKQSETPVLPSLKRPPDAIAIDLDGTLLNSQVLLSKRSAKAIEKCLAKPIPIVIATSRPARSVKRLLGVELMNRCSLVLENGAIGIAVLPFTGRIKETLSAELTREVISAILKLEPEMHITIELDGYSFGTNKPRDPKHLWRVNSATPDMQRSLESALADDPTKIAAGGLKRDISHVADAITRRFEDTISVVPANDLTFLNITSKKASKPDTLRRLLLSQKVALDNVIAFGDDIPDIGLLAACGIPVAVANAVPEIKALTRYCTASNDDDGVALALETILNL